MAEPSCGGFAIRVGDEFNDFHALQEAVTRYEKQTYISYWIRDSRTIDAARKRVQTVFRPELRYYELTFACIKGGRKYTSKSQGKRPNQRTFRAACQAAIKVRARRDGQKLVVRSITRDHNHDNPKETFHLLPKERRLANMHLEEVKDILRTRPNTKILQSHISKQSNKTILKMEDFTIGENIPGAMIEEKEKTKEELVTELKEAKAELRRLKDLLHFAELKLDVEQGRLMQENQVLQAELGRAQMRRNRELGEFVISSSLPEKPLEFTEVVDVMNEPSAEESLAIQSNFAFSTTVTYPLSSGDALITFEDEKVAQKVIARKIHFFVVENYTMEIKAFPIALELVQNFEINTEVSKTKILVWDIPNCFSPEQIEDKLELSFCKPSNGGGEVICVEYTPETSSAVLTFKDEGVAEKLICQRVHTINSRKDNVKVKVSPLLQGNLKNLNTYSAMSQRTVLLKDIVEVIAPEDLQDRLEIFFQKESNGGGEVQNIVYAPKKKRVLVRFGEFPSSVMGNS